MKQILLSACHKILLALPDDKPTPTTTSGKSVQPPPRKSAFLSYKRPSSVPSSTGSPVLTPKEALPKYITDINQDTFDPDEDPHAYTSMWMHCHLASFHKTIFYSRLPATSARQARVFAGGTIMRPHWAIRCLMSCWRC
jgi:hypothetical protein